MGQGVLARLTPYPFAALVRRVFRELDRRQAIFDLPARAFFLGDARKDLSVRVHGRPASTPFGPAAGPHTQLAQNIVLAWLGGGRVIELKTVQANDELSIPRPCIDVQTVGYNIEWSQELKIEQTLEECAKASMLIEILVASGALALAPDAARTVFDMSVGYDLAGISGGRVQAFVHGMLDAREVVERLRRQIPDEFRRYRDLDFSSRLSDTVTLSTFHGCPHGEIERIVEFLFRQHGLHVTIKLNPMLLGKPEALRLLHDVLGYDDIRVPDSAFDRDTTWDHAVALADRLGRTADGLGLGFGVKFANTLIVENRGTSLSPGQAEAYLSGPPLHVLAMHLVRRFRRQFGDRYPISFSGGIDRGNFADAVALGLAPVTVCTDLLKPGGYARAHGYLQALVERMDACDAATIDDFVLRAHGMDPARSIAGAKLRNTDIYVERATGDPRYARSRNSRTTKKIGRSLQLFDCLACDKCVPLCPNDANFTFVIPAGEIPIVKLRQENGMWRRVEEGTIAIEAGHQVGNFADFCNDCGNCDVFCPEDGGPYLVKPRVFGSRDGWDRSGLDGFYFERRDREDLVLGRFGGQAFELRATGARMAYSGDNFAVTFLESDPERTLEGRADAVADLTYCQIMNVLRNAILAADAVNYVTALLEE